MTNRKVLLSLIALLLPFPPWLLAAEVGAVPPEMLLCDSCHAEALDPPKGPPYWAIQNRYSRLYRDEVSFTAAIADFVSNPSTDKALMTQAVQQMGLMDPMPLPPEALQRAASYLYNTTFPPPCAHWKAGLKLSESQGDQEHAAQERRKIAKFCD